jgi:hypothetical protein
MKTEMTQSPPWVARAALLASALQPFREIAEKCTEEECIELIADCADSLDPVIRGPVKGLYEDRLFSLMRLRREVEHYEAIYG